MSYSMARYIARSAALAICPGPALVFTQQQNIDVYCEQSSPRSTLQHPKSCRKWSTIFSNFCNPVA